VFKIMLNKLDFQKKFELVVQQEIQNYQNSLNSILQAIRDIKISIQDSKTESLENYALLDTVQNVHSTDLMNLKLEFSDKIQKIESRINDLCKKTAQIDELFSKMRINEEKVTEKYTMLESKLEGIYKDVDQIKISLLVNKRSSEDTHINLVRQIKDSFELQKKELAETPSQLCKAKKEIDDKLNTHIVDVEGILKELTAYKKENYITQKKIENIYTLIERLKK